MIFVPDRILTAVCFPDAPCDIQYPHMTVMLNKKLQPIQSNQLLKATCDDPNKFQEPYLKCKNNELLEKSKVYKTTADVVDQFNQLEAVIVYFIVFGKDDRVTFKTLS